MLLIRTLKSTLLGLTAVLVLGASSAAAATNEIEGVWSFNGGSVAIQPQPNGTFTGTVVTETKFDDCPHTPGEEMWTGMTARPDGSFWGLHQWFQTQCVAEKGFLGPTAWRVLQGPKGGRYLKVCFSYPGGGQPEIAASGAETKPLDFFNCYESALIEPLPVVSGGSGAAPLGSTVVLPTTTACVSQSLLKIKLKDPKSDHLKEVVVKLNGKKVATVKGVVAINKALKKGGITLTKLPSGTYKINVTATTVLHRTLTGSQSYKACTRGSGSIGLKGKKTHHKG